MIRLDAATVLLQWATGGLLFLWVTTRRRQVGIGYGWLLRSVYALLAAGAVAAGTDRSLPALARATSPVIAEVRPTASLRAGSRASFSFTR